MESRGNATLTSWEPQRIDAKLHSSSNNCWNPDETLQSLQPQKTWQGAEKTLHTHKFKRLDRKQKKNTNYTLTSSEPQDLKNTTHSQVQNLKRLDTEQKTQYTFTDSEHQKTWHRGEKNNTHSQVQSLKRLDRMQRRAGVFTQHFNVLLGVDQLGMEQLA